MFCTNDWVFVAGPLVHLILVLLTQKLQLFQLELIMSQVQCSWLEMIDSKAVIITGLERELK